MQLNYSNMTQCTIHNQEMKEFWKKSDPDHKGQSWFSHKTEEGEWCSGKPKEARYNQGYTQSAKTIAEYEKPDWDKIAVGKVASNLAVALVERGETIDTVRRLLPEIFKLANAIVEAKNEDMSIPF